MKVIAGDWPEGREVVVGAANVAVKKGAFSFDKIPVGEIADFTVITEENRASVVGTLGWGALGAVALGPLGLLAGVLAGGNKKDRLMSVVFRDGRKLLVKGTPKDVEMFSKVTFGSS